MPRTGATVLFMLFIALPGSGCYPVFPGLDRDMHAADYQAQERSYAEALAGYQSLVSRTGTSRRDAAARYSIAVILASHDNPQRNYAKALDAFNEFLKRYPDHERAPDAANWAAALRTLQEAKQENEQLKKNIEQLKRLDIRQEKKRERR